MNSEGFCNIRRYKGTNTKKTCGISGKGNRHLYIEPQGKFKGYRPTRLSSVARGSHSEQVVGEQT